VKGEAGTLHTGTHDDDIRRLVHPPILSVRRSPCPAPVGAGPRQGRFPYLPRSNGHPIRWCHRSRHWRHRRRTVSRVPFEARAAAATKCGSGSAATVAVAPGSLGTIRPSRDARSRPACSPRRAAGSALRHRSRHCGRG
jgi:hypothetical protein